MPNGNGKRKTKDKTWFKDLDDVIMAVWKGVIVLALIGALVYVPIKAQEANVDNMLLGIVEGALAPLLLVAGQSFFGPSRRVPS